jgi:hypothetical protein
VEDEAAQEKELFTQLTIHLKNFIKENCVFKSSNYKATSYSISVFRDSFLKWLKTNYPTQKIHPKFILQLYFNINKITTQFFNRGTLSVSARDASGKRFVRL